MGVCLPANVFLGGEVCFNDTLVARKEVFKYSKSIRFFLPSESGSIGHNGAGGPSFIHPSLFVAQADLNLFLVSTAHHATELGTCIPCSQWHSNIW